MIVWLWSGFVAFILVMLFLDLFVVNRKAHVIRAREALAWTGVTVVLALAFTFVVYYIYAHDVAGIGSKFQAQHAPTAEAIRSGHSAGMRAALEFLTGWVIEYSLSLDNIFVIAMIFGHFRVPSIYQHRVLFWGVLGALIMRGVMIAAGAALIHRFEWIIFVFGGFLIFTAIRLLRQKEENFDPEHGWLLRGARRLLPLTPGLHEEKFLIRQDGRLFMTPLFLVLLVVESTDVVFAIDSIPAIFAITRDPFLVFTSNVFAILGLRSLYFALAALIVKFEYLKYSLAFILGFVGVKMVLEGLSIHVPVLLSLGVIVVALGAGAAVSVMASRRRQEQAKFET
jgi:tellurite resistance protein TerC